MAYNRKEHLTQSIRALKTVFLIEKENRTATSQEMDVLKQYRGFGAIKAVLRPLTGKESWPKSEQALYPLIEELDQLLRNNSDGEVAYKECLDSIRSSVLTAFYTPEAIIYAIAETLQSQGISAKKILEPSAGIGAFFNAFKGNEPIVAYEKDIMTARILAKLFPNDIIRATGYETINSSYAGSFDLIVSNIPFGDVSVFDPGFVRSNDKVKRFASQSLHNYFFVKSIENLREGGVLAFITTQAIMNTPSNEIVRQYLMDNSNLVTAIRLPNNLFASHAGTEVGTDLIILQKNSNKIRLSPEEQSFINVETSPEGITENIYFKLTKNIIHTSEIVGTNLYGNPAMIYTFEGTVDEMAHELSRKLTIELAENIDKGLFHKHEISSGKDNQIELVEKVVPQLSLYDLFGLSNEERTQIKAVKKGRKSSPARPQIVTVEPFDPSPRPFKRTVPTYYEEGMLASQGTLIGHTRLENGQLLFCPMEITEEQEARILTYINIRDAYLSLYNNELTSQKEDAKEREHLNLTYDAFVEKYGNLAEPTNLEFINMDKFSAEILSLEQWQGQQVSKADIFFHPVGFAIQEKTHTDDIFEALSFSLNRFMKVDIDYMCRLTGLDIENIKESLFDKIYWNPFDKEYQMREVYIAGNVVEKANSLERYLQDNPDDTESRHSYEAMKAAVPERIPFEELDFNFGERWIKDSIYSDFASQLFDTNVTVAYDGSSDDYVVSFNGYSSAIFHQYNVQGESRNYNGIKLLEHALLNTSPKITKTIHRDGHDVRVKDANAIQLANNKIDEIRNKFNEWLISRDETFKESLVNDYNDRYNCFVRPQYDGSHQRFPELDLKALDIPDLYKSQKDAIYMLKCNQGGIIDHEVGGGKTLIICIAAYEMKRLGIINRPLIIGLKANIDAIATTYATAYPNARILYSGNEDFSPSSREQFYYKLKNNSWDAIILTHEQFGMIPQSEEIQTKILKQELDSTEENLRIMYQDKGISTQLLKGLIKRKENLSAKLKELQFKMDLHKDNVTDFKSLGIDHIFVDESHMFKNLMFNTRHDRVAGIGNNAGSQRALNMLYAIRTIQERTGRDLGATFLSGTVISNSLTELYSVFKYMRPKALETQNIRSFDAWAAVFAKKTIDYEFSVTNEIIQKERFRYFIKVPELAQFYNEITDYRTAQEIGIDRPEKNTILRNIPQTAEQEAFAESLIAFAKTGDGTLIGRLPLSDAEKTAKMLIATNTSKKMSLDMRLIDSQQYSDDPQNKVSVAAKELADRYYRYDNCKGTQFVFCDLGTYKKENWNVYSELKRKLVEEYKIPSAEIRFIQEATSDKTRNNIINMMNKGAIRILLGSTQKLGTGVNAQQRAVAVHHLDVTWRPSDLTQRDGRAVRKGNEVAKLYAGNKVDVIFYAVEKTLDSYMFNLLHNKQLFITQMKQGTTGVRTLDEGSLDESNGMNFSEYVAVLSGNPELLEKARLEKKIAALEGERVSFQRNKRQYNAKITSFTKALDNKNRIIGQLEKDRQQLFSQIKYDDKNMPLSPVRLDGPHTHVTGEKNIGAYLCNLADTLDTGGQDVHIGSLYGFGLFVQTKTIQAEDELFKTNKFFVQGDGGIRYTHLNGILPHTPELATASFLKALQVIPKLLESNIAEKDKIEKDMQTFNDIVNSPFSKERELIELRDRLSTVGRILQVSLENETGEGQSTDNMSEATIAYDKHSGRQLIIPEETIERQLTPKERNSLPDGQRLEDELLTPPSRKIENGEFYSIARTFRRTGSISFCGSDKIETPEDVAWIFRYLENSSVENAYMAYVCSGKTVIQHLSVGEFNSTPIPIPSIVAAVRKLNPEAVYLIHNHPGGNLVASYADRNMLRKLTLALGDIVKEGIIININSGKYGLFDKDGSMGQEYFNQNSNQMEELPIYSFDKIVFNKDYIPEDMVSIKSSRDIARYISGHRLGGRDKVNILVLTPDGRIIANLFTSFTAINRDNAKEIAKEAVDATILYGGIQFILDGRFSLDKEALQVVHKESRRLSGDKIYPLDMISVLNTQNDSLSYLSAVDEGCMENSMPYGFSDIHKIGKALEERIFTGMKEAIMIGIPIISQPYLEQDMVSFNEFASEYGFAPVDVMKVYEKRKVELGDYFGNLIGSLTNGNNAKHLNLDSMENVKKLDESRINWDEMKSKFGITKEMLEEKEVLQSMLYFKKSNALLKVIYEGQNGSKEFDARVQFTEKNGEYSMRFYPVLQAPQLEKPYHGYVFSDEDKKSLLETGNLGRVATIEQYGGGTKNVYISIDPLTNDIVHMDCVRLKIKDEIKGVQLNEEQKSTIMEGKPVYIKGMTANSGKEFNAYLQVNADTKNVAISYPKSEIIEDIYSLKEIKGVPVNPEQLAMLSKGEKIELLGLARRTGGAFDAIVSYNSDTKKIEYGFPQRGLDEIQTQRIFVPSKLKGVKLTRDQQAGIERGEKVLISGMTSSKGTSFDAYVFMDKDAGRLNMEFPVKNELMGVVLTAEQKGKLQAGEAVWIGGLKKKNGETFKAPILWDPKEGKFTFQARKESVEQKTGTSKTESIEKSDKPDKQAKKVKEEDNNAVKKNKQKL